MDSQEKALLQQSTLEDPAKKAYATKQEVLERVKEIAHSSENPNKEELDLLKTTFYKIHLAERDAQMKEYLAKGGDPEKYILLPDDTEEAFKAEMQLIKEKRAKIFLAQEEEKQDNLRKKEEMEGYNIDNEVIKYIATNIKSNIRELEGALNKLLAYSNLEKTEITMEIAQKELQNIITPDKPKEITPQLIIEVVSEHFQISLDQMISKNRSKDIARPRQIAMYLCKNMTDTPLDSIGALLGGRDHSTIVYSLQQMEKSIETEEHTKEIIDDIIKNIRGMDHQR